MFFDISYVGLANEMRSIVYNSMCNAYSSYMRTRKHNSSIYATRIRSFLNKIRQYSYSYLFTASVVIGLLSDTDIQPLQKVPIKKLKKAILKLTNLIREAQFYSEVESQKASVEGIYKRVTSYDRN